MTFLQKTSNLQFEEKEDVASRFPGNRVARMSGPSKGEHALAANRLEESFAALEAKSSTLSSAVAATIIASSYAPPHNLSSLVVLS